MLKFSSIRVEMRLEERCYNIRSSPTDIRIPENSENSEYICCIDVNTRILSVPKNFKNFQHIWWPHRNSCAPSDLGIHVNSLKFSKFLGADQGWPERGLLALRQPPQYT